MMREAPMANWSCLVPEATHAVVEVVVDLNLKGRQNQDGIPQIGGNSSKTEPHSFGNGLIVQNSGDFVASGWEDGLQNGSDP